MNDVIDDVSADCSNPQIITVDITDTTTGEVNTGQIQTRCKTKKCPECGPWLCQCHFAHHLRTMKGLPNLFAVTLCLRPSFYDSLPLSEWCNEISNKRKVLFARFRRSFNELKYFWVFEQKRFSVPHFHATISTGKGERDDHLALIERHFFKCGAGTNIMVESLESPESVARWIGYSFKNFCNSGRDDQPDYMTLRKTYSASRGLGFNSQEQRRLRRKVAREKEGKDAFVLEKDADRVIANLLSEFTGTRVETSFGRVGILKSMDERHAIVDIEGSLGTFKHSDLTPVERAMPQIYEFHSPPKRKGMNRSGATECASTELSTSYQAKKAEFTWRDGDRIDQRKTSMVY